MRSIAAAVATALISAWSSVVHAENLVIAEDDASESAYRDGWTNEKNGGSGFSNWILLADGNDKNRHAGFFIADTKNKSELSGIEKENKAFGLYANGPGFEQAVAIRPFERPLQPGDSFSFMMKNGPFEKKFERDDPTPGSVGVALRNGNAKDSVADYNKNAVFAFGYDPGKPNYQIYDGSENSDSGVALNESGVSVSVTLKGGDNYDLEIETMNDKKVIKLPNRKLKSAAPIESFVLFDRNGEKNDAYFNQFQITRDSKGTN